MNRHDYHKWDEHTWEAELKRDDDRIAAFVRELSTVLDLPGEAELIIKKLERHPELMPDMAMWRDDGWDFDDDDEEFTEEWKDKPGMSLLTELGVLATDFSRILASSPTCAGSHDGLPIVCEYGRAASYAIDMLELAKNELPNLKIALFKRLAASLNRLIELINEFKWQVTSKSSELEGQVERLHVLREAAIHLQFEIRENDISF